mmetsp:Transcript_36896/g.59690  ORF Transcript_36896/g.59690 Transcript_36896/m.59690 type:complete len:395 (+) Transcript_36896:91-1275(+)
MSVGARPSGNYGTSGENRMGTQTLLRKSKRNGEELRNSSDPSAAKRRAALCDISNETTSKAVETESGSNKQFSFEDPISSVHAVLGKLLRSTTKIRPRASRTEKAEPPENDEGPVVDIDIADAGDPMACTQYVNDIYACLRDTERRYRSTPNYMELLPQRDVNPTMRGILVDWLVEVAEEYRLLGETLDLSVNFIDRYLRTHQVHRGRLQLVGITCMLIAAKYEEIYAPQVDEFVYISDNTYGREEVLYMETDILNQLNWEVAAATPKAFLKRFNKAAHADPVTAMLAQYIAELALQEYSFLKYLPSNIAAASLSIALQVMHLPSWTPTLRHYTGYSESDLEESVSVIFPYYRDSSKSPLQAVREKYSHSKFLRVSHIQPPPSIQVPKHSVVLD